MNNLLSVTFDMPSHVKAGLMSGEYIRNGGVIQNQLGHVVVWLQEHPESIRKGIVKGVNLASHISPIGVASFVLEAGNAAVTQFRLGAVKVDVEEIKERVGSMATQVDQVQQSILFLSAPSLLTLGFAAMNFKTINQKVKIIEGSLKTIEAKLARLDQKINISFYANFCAAIDLANNAFTMQDTSNRKESALKAIDRFLEAEHTYLSLVENEIEEDGVISDKYLLTLKFSFLSEVRCYLELGEYETARHRLTIAVKKIRDRVLKYIEILLTENPGIYLHPSLSEVIDLPRLTQIYQWLDPGETESSVFERFRSNVNSVMKVNDWSRKLPRAISQKPVIQDDKSNDNMSGFSENFEAFRGGLESIKNGKWKSIASKNTFSSLSKAIEDIETMIETMRRLESYQYEIKFLEENKMPLHQWLQLIPNESSNSDSNLIFITPETPLSF